MSLPHHQYPINIIARRMRHHAKASGYDRLTDYLDGDIIYPITEWRFHQRAIARVGNYFIRHSGSRWYHRDSFLCELGAARKWLHGRGQIFHFLYGENLYRYLGNMKSLGIRNAIVCTYHTPAEKFNQIITDKKPIKRLDAVITVSSIQQEMFTDFIAPGRVHFIPHGIDVEFFRPPENSIRGDVCKCLCVGSHLRDFDALASAAKALQGKNIEFTVVTSAAHHGKFAGLDNVKLLSGIDDNQLLSIYQSSDIFVMPVTDCTANNALLEAMACGLPIIATDLVGIRDYISEESAILTRKGDARSLADAIEYLYSNKARRQGMASASRDHALNFGWEKIAAQVMDIYEELSG